VRRSIVGIVFAGLLMVWPTSEAGAQGPGGGGFTGSTGGFGGGGGFTGSSGGIGGNTSRGTTGAGFSGGGFTGSTAFSGGTTGAGTFGTAGGATNYGATSFEGRYYGNPLAIGAPTTSSTGSQYLRAFPTQLPTFGQPLYGTAGLTTTPRTTTNPYTSTNPYGTALVIPASLYGGANSGGIRRAPSYITVPDFDRPPPPTASAMQTNLQDIIARSTRLTSRNGIRVSVEGGAVILRGQVRDERERRLAESLVRLTPGVRAVKNELVPLAPGGRAGR
jgi:hypothetical protein